VFKPATTKGAHKSFDSFFCDCGGIVKYQDQGHALLCLFGDGSARVYSIPSLREIASIKPSEILDVRRFDAAVIAPTGHILGFTGPSELALLSIWGTGEPLNMRSGQDKLFNPEALIPPRPTISTVQWVTGTQYITPADMDVLIGGPSRPPSKRMIAQARAEGQQRRQTGRDASGPASSAAAADPGQADEGYWAYMQRQIQERTEKLGIMGDTMNNLEESSSNWADDVSKFVSRQKRNAAGGSKLSLAHCIPLREDIFADQIFDQLSKRGLVCRFGYARMRVNETRRGYQLLRQRSAGQGLPIRRKLTRTKP